VGAEVNWDEWMCHLDWKGGRKFGNSKLWKGEVAKNLCWHSGNSDIQEGVNQSKKSDSVEKKAMLSSTTMVHLHPTQPKISADNAIRTQILYLLC